MRTLLIFLCFMSFAAVHAEEAMKLSEVVTEAEIEDAEPTLEDRANREKLYFLPRRNSGNVSQSIFCGRKSATCYAESFPDLLPLKCAREPMKPNKAMPGYREQIVVWGKPGTEVRLTQTFSDPAGIQRTRFFLGVKPPKPNPDPVDPDPVNPNPPKPEPAPDKYDRVHVVIIASPRDTTAEQSQIMGQMRLAQDRGEFADQFREYDINGQDETGKQSVIVKSYIDSIDKGAKLPYWFVVGVKDGKGIIAKEGELTSFAEVMDEVRQAKKSSSGSVSNFTSSSRVLPSVKAGYWKTIPCPT